MSNPARADKVCIFNQRHDLLFEGEGDIDEWGKEAGENPSKEVESVEIGLIRWVQAI